MRPGCGFLALGARALTTRVRAELAERSVPIDGMRGRLVEVSVHLVGVSVHPESMRGRLFEVSVHLE